MNAYFITGTGTSIGKTFVSCALIHQLRAAGRTVRAIKPVISGFDADNASASDTGRILASLEREITPATLHAISPWRFSAPLSPDIAAAREQSPIEMRKLLEFCTDAVEGDEDITLIEGAGGVMSPLTESHTNLDVIESLSYPVILVAGNYLGTITHTLTAVTALRMAGAELHAVVVSESHLDAPDLADTLVTLQRFLPGVPCHALMRVKGNDWRHAGPLAERVFSP